MAALVKAVNAKIRSNPVLDYVCSTRKFSYPAATAARPLRASADNPR
jgi:hypothetical protein